jgi:hypothetical protein
LFSSEFNLKVSREYACVVKALTLLAPTLAYSKTIIALCFTCFSSFEFILAMFRFFDKNPIENKLGFKKNMFKLTFIHSIHLLTRGYFKA